MLELTEQQVQEMIDRARTGDPEANYQMSQWALDQALAEPEEERWNRLAAKCLVRAAEAGYAPAQQRMDELIQQLEEEESGRSGAAPEAPEPAPRPERKAPAAKKPASGGVSGAAAKVGALFRGFGSSSEKKPARSGGQTSGEKAPFFRFSEWNDDQWKTLQRVCLIICAVLAVFIIILLISHGARKDKEPEPVETTPEVVITPEPVAPTPTPLVEVYPDEATRSRIAAANLDVFPEDLDYVTAQTSGTISTSGSDLNMRRGTASSYGIITTIPNGTSVEVYAYKNSWALVQYGSDLGWVSSEFLK